MASSAAVFLLGGKIRRDGLDREVGVDEKALRGVAEAGGGPEIVIDGGIDLVDAVDPATVGMEDYVARTGARTIVGEEVRDRMSCASFGVDVEDGRCDRCRDRRPEGSGCRGRWSTQWGCGLS